MLLLVVLTALAISMATTPLLMRLAPRLRMVDLPDPRKVHAVPIPRVGGIGIIAGALVSAMLWIEPQPWFSSYLLGSLVLLAFGTADDSRGLGHYAKFIGQIVAAVAVVYWGNVCVTYLPFMEHELAPAIGKPFTVFALVGVINAINHSDGLDGLAGGESLLCLCCIAYLGYVAGGMEIVMLAAAVGGGVFGFLRFNTHPAQVFMGDAGSQFLGFSLGVLVVLLTQNVNPGLSMALPALIIGLPIVDILAVFAQRVYLGFNWFRATRNHIHHRLLNIGFSHGKAVVVIYAVQVILVFSAIPLSYESDALVASFYLAVCAAVFTGISLAERRGWRIAAATPTNDTDRFASAEWLMALRRLPLRFVKTAIPLYLLVAGFLAGEVPFEFAAVITAALGLAGISLLIKNAATRRSMLRIALYSVVVCVVFLLDRSGKLGGGLIATIEMAYFALLGLAVAAALRLQYGTHGFRTTPLDFLMVVLAVVSGLLAARQIADGGMASGLIVRLAVLFYACELIISDRREREPAVPEWSLIGVATLLLGKTAAID